MNTKFKIEANSNSPAKLRQYLATWNQNANPKAEEAKIFQIKPEGWLPNY